MHVTKAPYWSGRAAAAVLGALGWIAAGSNAFATQTITLTIPGVHSIQLISFSTSASNTATGPGTSGKAVCGRVVVTKNIDNDSYLFLSDLFRGSVTHTMTITFDDNGRVDYTLQLDDVIVTQVSQSDAISLSQLTESVEFLAAKYVYTFVTTARTGPVARSFSWDCTTNNPG
jgi:type VI protein secretion system component Hcp